MKRYFRWKLMKMTKIVKQFQECNLILNTILDDRKHLNKTIHFPVYIYQITYIRYTIWSKLDFPTLYWADVCPPQPINDLFEVSIIFVRQICAFAKQSQKHTHTHNAAFGWTTAHFFFLPMKANKINQECLFVIFVFSYALHKKDKSTYNNYAHIMFTYETTNIVNINGNMRECA